MVCILEGKQRISLVAVGSARRSALLPSCDAGDDCQRCVTWVQVALSTQEKVLLRIPLQQPPLEVLLTRQQLDGLAVPLFKRALVPLEDACQQVC